MNGLGNCQKSNPGHSKLSDGCEEGGSLKEPLKLLCVCVFVCLFVFWGGDFASKQTEGAVRKLPLVSSPCLSELLELPTSRVAAIH